MIRNIVLNLMAFAFIAALAAVAEAERSNFQRVELDPPAVMKLVPVQDGPLLRGERFQFTIELKGAPKPINMWSCRIDYTSPTLELETLYAPGKENENAVVISDPYSVSEHWESRSISGVSLPGWTDGKLLTLTFRVREGAPNLGSLRLGPHPSVPEGLAHDSPETRTTYDYARKFDNVMTGSVKVVDVSEEHPPYAIPTPTPRTLFSREKK